MKPLTKEQENTLKKALIGFISMTTIFKAAMGKEYNAESQKVIDDTSELLDYLFGKQPKLEAILNEDGSVTTREI